MLRTEQGLTASDLRRRLGVLPVPLLETEKQRFVMLNGIKGNFCFDASGDCAPDAQAIAWSADVGHYVHVLGDSVTVYRWDITRPQTVSRAKLAAGIEMFQRFLEEDEPRQDGSIVRHVIGILDHLRSLTSNGGKALDALLVLLACADSKTTPDDLDIDQYALNQSALTVAQKINSDTWRQLEAALLRPANMPTLRLEPSIALRHCAGQLFQEAHWRTADPAQQLTIDGILPNRARVARGQSDVAGVYFTPSTLARTLVEQALRSADLSQPTIHVFDPACGSAEFLAEAARQIRQRGYDGRLILSGYDLSERAVATAKFVLSAQFAKDGRNDIDIQIADSLRAKCRWPDCDFLFMNPPFISWWNMNQEQRNIVRSTVGASMRAKPDYSAAFIKRALAAKPKTIGAVLITSCLDSESFKDLRREWLDVYAIEFVARLGNLSLFRAATVDSALVLGQRDVRDTESTMLWTDQRSTSVAAGLRALRRGPEAQRGDGYGIYVEHIDATKPDWSPRPLVSLELLEANQGVPSVCDLFDVRQGVITGLNRAFVLPVHAYNKLPKAERQYFRPALLNSTIRDGRLHLTHYLWYPYKSGDKLFRSERDVRETVPMYYDIYLARHKAGLSERRGMKARWWELIWPRLDREGPKIVTTYYGGVGSFAFDADDKYSVVQGYSWYPKSFKTLFESSVSYAYVALLNTNVFIVALSGHARIVGGGQVDLSKRFLAQTPLPSLYDGVDPALVARLIPIGKALSSGESVDRAELESLAKSVYGHG